MKPQYYDIIGDVHGHATLLKKLLKTMGYVREHGLWRHPERIAIFIGDFINRGPEIRETIEIVRQMTEAGSALTILGNHEYSAILYHIKDSSGMYLSRHIAGNRNQIQSTLTSFIGFETEWRDHLKWLRTLPFYLDLGGLRVVHAYWNEKDINYLKKFIPKGKLKKDFLRTIHENQQPTASIIYKILKGLEFRCPSDLILKCNKGMSRKVFRMNWWESPNNKTFRDLAFGNKFILPNYTVPQELAPIFEPYGSTNPPVIVGHYCLSEGAAIIQQNICCVDSAVVGSEQLSAYRWSGEEVLTKENLISVSA
jgi:Calcineurin-like phosphoesterase